MNRAILNLCRHSKLIYPNVLPSNVQTSASIFVFRQLCTLKHTNKISLLQTQNVLACQGRFYANPKKEESSKTDIVESKENPYAGLTTGQKVKEAGKDASYAVIIAVGVGITGIMFYMIGRELFSSQSPSGIFGDALKKCESNDQLIGMLGQPMKGYGETTRRGRRRHVSHQEFEMGGVMHLRMRFYVEGPRGKATVTAEMKKNDRGNYEYRYIVAEMDGYPRRSVLVVDNT